MGVYWVNGFAVSIAILLLVSLMSGRKHNGMVQGFAMMPTTTIGAAGHRIGSSDDNTRALDISQCSQFMDRGNQKPHFSSLVGPLSASSDDSSEDEAPAGERRAAKNKASSSSVIKDESKERLSLLQNAQTVGYRVFMLALTTVYGLQLTVVPFLQQEAGLSIVEDGNLLLSGDPDFVLLRALVLVTCVLAPRASTSGFFTAVVKIAVLTSGVASVVLLPSAVSIGLAGLCFREIIYFGISYKVEAALCILTLVGSFVLGSDEAALQQALHLLTALSMGVLVFGKFLEPLQEDWEVNKSEFLSENRLD